VVSESDVFGSPKTHDAVGEADNMVERLAQEQADMMNQLMKEYPRQVGSKPVPKAQREMEYQATKMIPGALRQYWADQKASLEDAITHAWEMEKK
jgi:hypothetical protein